MPAVGPLLDALVTRAGIWTSRELYVHVQAEAREAQMQGVHAWMRSAWG